MRKYIQYILVGVFVIAVVASGAYGFMVTQDVVAAPLPPDDEIPVGFPSPPPAPLMEIFWDSPGSGATLSGEVELRVRVMPSTITPGTVSWCFTSGATCNPSTAMVVDPGNATNWLATWNTAGETNGAYTICALATNNTIIEQACRPVNVSNQSEGPNANLNCTDNVDVKDLGIMLGWFYNDPIDGGPYPNVFAPGAQPDGTYKHPDCP